MPVAVHADLGCLTTEQLWASFHRRCVQDQVVIKSPAQDVGTECTSRKQGYWVIGNYMRCKQAPQDFYVPSTEAESGCATSSACSGVAWT